MSRTKIDRVSFIITIDTPSKEFYIFHNLNVDVKKLTIQSDKGYILHKVDNVNWLNNNQIKVTTLYPDTTITISTECFV